MLLASGRRTADDSDRRDRLAALVDGWPARGIVPVYADFVRAMIATAEAAPPDERVLLWRALDARLQEDPVLPVWHRLIVRTCLAAALLETGAREEAAERLAAVETDAVEGGVARVGRWARELAAHAGLTVAERSADPGTGPLAALTARERQVLALLAEGLTNPQIGERLFISPKTASVHVSAILTKIGAANRAEAAALYAASLDA
jgi:DNA-binding CsgD family transcriptional regulator